MAGEDSDYTDWIRRQPCNECGRSPGCDPHHRTGAGMAMRSHDHKAIPLCRFCHETFHAGSGTFKRLDKQGKRDYQDEAIERCRRVYNASKGPAG